MVSILDEEYMCVCKDNSIVSYTETRRAKLHKISYKDFSWHLLKHLGKFVKPIVLCKERGDPIRKWHFGDLHPC